jgi:hypothetical protein
MTNVIDSLKVRYKNIHPLIFLRSREKAKSEGELFDILEDFPNQYPVIWDEDARRWLHTDDLFQSKNSEMKPGNEL